MTVDDVAWPAVAPSSARLEDPRPLTGAGRFLANQTLPRGCLRAIIVRSDTPKGCITKIDAAAALEVDGVVAVLTGDDLAAMLGPFPNIVAGAPDYFAIASWQVRYVGEPVAVVLAESEAAALDGADAVVVVIEPDMPVAGLTRGRRAPARPQHPADPGMGPEDAQ